MRRSRALASPPFHAMRSRVTSPGGDGGASWGLFGSVMRGSGAHFRISGRRHLAMRNATVLTAVFLSVLSTGMPVEASTWTIPGTVNAGGLNNTRFVSDLAVTNPGSVPAQATISFIPANGTTPKQVTLNAGQTVVYRNVLDSLWGAQGAGATQVASASPLLIRARTYNTAASGTYGVALPVFADERLLSLGDTADSLWISQSADAASGYRTNVSVVFPDAGGGSATVTIFDANGGEIGSQDYSLDT